MTPNLPKNARTGAFRRSGIGAIDTATWSNAPVTIRDFYNVPRVTEIGTDILESLDELEQAMTRVVAAGTAGEW